MSNDAGAHHPAGHPPTEVPLPAYGHPAPQAHPAYPGYFPPGYPPVGYPLTLKPGIIPLRPLTLGEIYNAAVDYIRKNPKSTLGLTAVVIVVAQIVGLIIQVGPLSATGALRALGSGEFDGTVSDGAMVGVLATSLAGSVATVLGGIVLSGLLTVVVGRAVFGATITVAEAWQRVRGRLLALLGFTLLEALGAVALVAVVVGLVFVVGFIAGGVASFVIGSILFVALIPLTVYLYTILSFVPALIVLERLGVAAAVTRSYALIRNDFWRVLGISALAVIAAGLIAGAVSAPFSFVGQILVLTVESTTGIMVALVLIAVGSAIGQIITAPFNAGVVVLLYADRRMRSEAFDLVLQMGATGIPGPSQSTDDLWLTPQP